MWQQVLVTWWPFNKTTRQSVWLPFASVSLSAWKLKTYLTTLVMINEPFMNTDAHILSVNSELNKIIFFPIYNNSIDPCNTGHLVFTVSVDVTSVTWINFYKAHVKLPFDYCTMTRSFALVDDSINLTMQSEREKEREGVAIIWISWWSWACSVCWFKLLLPAVV